MLSLLFGLAFILQPLLRVPLMLERKKELGYFFSEDPRILVGKGQNFGNNLNTKNKYGWFLQMILSLALIIFGILSLLN